MMTVCKAIFALFLNVVLIQTASAWDHSIELGYGRSHDPNNTRYFNSGLFLSSDIYPLQASPWYFLTINGAVGEWMSSAPKYKHLTTAALALALRVYPFNYGNQVYLLGSAGPAYLSNRRFGTNYQAGDVSFQLNGGFGVEFNQFDINLRLVHFSNAHLSKPDDGFNILYTLSVGYLF